MDKNKLILYGGVAVAAILVYALLSGTRKADSTATTAIAITPQLSSAVAANNDSAYSYMSQVANANAAATASIWDSTTTNLSAYLQTQIFAQASIAQSAADASANRNAMVGAVRISQQQTAQEAIQANAAIELANVQASVDKALIGIQIPIAQIAADTEIKTTMLTTAADTNIAKINADRDVAIAFENANADIVVNSSWAKAAIEQAKYAYKSSLGQQGALGWGNLIMGASAAFSGFGVAASKGTSSNKGGSGGASASGYSGSASAGP